MVCPLVARQCVGKKCAAWRWKAIYQEQLNTNSRFPMPPALVGYSTTEGYCGMVKHG
jgi:hypothetical protein